MFEFNPTEIGRLKADEFKFWMKHPLLEKAQVQYFNSYVKLDFQVGL